MMSLFSRGSSPPPAASASSSLPQNVQNQNQQQQSSSAAPTAAPTTNTTTTMMNTSSSAEPASHVIHSPLPSRPSPVEPTRTIDELLQGFHSGSPQPSERAHTPPSAVLTTNPAASLSQQQQQQQPPPPPAIMQAQPPSLSQSSQDRNNMDLLAMLSNPLNSASPASVSSSQPTQKSNPAQDQSNAGRMLLDSLLSSSAPQPPPRPADVGASFQSSQPEQPQQPQQQQQQQQQPRKTAFDFVSPMDAFSQSSPMSINAPGVQQKRNTDPIESAPASATLQSTNLPVTQHMSGSQMSQDGGDVDHSRRKSIDLLEQLTRTATISHPPISNDMNTPTAPTLLGNFGQPSQPPPPPQQFRPQPRVPSPPSFPQQRDQSPALIGQTPPSTSPAIGLSGPVSAAAQQNTNQARASPTFKGRIAGNGQKKDWKKNNSAANDFLKSRGSPAGPQSFTLDLSLPLAATSASSDRLHITPIALLKLESIYVPGCTIGVSHWIAYAMTKGRVRLIARANGARALLKLPPSFSVSSSIVDLVTSGNRLAGVTSDGGFVVWEVPPMVDDDIPSLLLVSVPPNPTNPYKSIKWHPTDPDILALSTTSEIHLINVQRLYHIHNGESIGQNTLVGDAEIFPAASGGLNNLMLRPEQQIAAFAFDPSHNALATISQEGTMNVWAVGSQQPPSYQAEPSYGHPSYMQQHQLLWSGKIPGEGAPSSLFFMDQAQGVIIGRKRNTIIQLVPPKSSNVQASVKFVHGTGVFGAVNANNIPDDNQFFAHLAYDPRIKCIWAASSHRSSIMALRIASFDSSTKAGLEAPLLFEQILDFPILHPTISLGILVSSEGNDVEEMERGSSAMDVTGASVPPGPGGEISMALVAYVIHAGGVDQVLIGKQDLESASQTALSKLPVQVTSPNQLATPRQDSPNAITPTTRNPHPSGPRDLLKQGTPPNAQPIPPPNFSNISEPPPSFGISAPTNPTTTTTGNLLSAGGRNFGPMDTNSPQRPRSPASDPGAESAEPADSGTPQHSGSKKNRRGRDKKGGGGGQGGHHGIPGNSSAAESAVSSLAGDASANIIKEINKVEDGISNKITAVVGREFRDQQRRLEQMHEQERFNAAEFQDRLVKNLSGELVKSTGRVFEAALKTEVQRTILPALEIITKTEVRQVLDGQIVRGIGESMNQTLPNEIERLLLRPDVSNHVARTFSSTVTPIIERHVKDSINRTLIPAYQESTTEMYDQLYREISEEILNLKKEIVTWQSDALKGQESLLRDMELSIRSLTEQVKTLVGNRSNTPYHIQSHRSSPAPLPVHIRQQPPTTYPAMDKWQQMAGPPKPEMPVPPLQNAPQHQPPLPIPMPTQSSYAPPPQIPAHVFPAQQPPVQQSLYQQDRPEEWEKAFLSALSSPDIRPLRELLSQCPADKVIPLNGPLLVGQTIVLSVIHKVAGTLADVETIEESISLLWWLTRASQVLDAHDRIIHDYLDKMLPNIQENLFRAIPRFSAAGPQYNRQMSDLLQTLVIKAHNPQ